MAFRELLASTFHAAQQLASQAPVVNVLPILADAERIVVKVVRDHLADLERHPPSAVEPAPPPPESPSDALRLLLDSSMYNSPEDSRVALYLGLLRDLVPDEARILAALSDGSRYPVLDIAEPTVGTSTAFVLTNASTVGRAAGVSLPAYTPVYVTRLVRMDLITIGPDGGDAMTDDYEILLTDAAVNVAIATARRGVRSARVIRRTVRMSELGQELWDAAK